MTTDTTNPSDHDFLDYALSHGFGDIHMKVDPRSGMRAIIAIHSTKLGPALGGCRFIEYADTDAAIKDAMRLAIGMSNKSALANLPIGGGKAVIMKPKGNYDRTAYLKQFGLFINELNGRYITALDSGTQLEDMDIIAEYTPYVASVSTQHGDPAPCTADGVFRGIQAAIQFKLHTTELKGLHVAIQGLGHVGYRLAERLHAEGVKLSVADINSELVERAARKFNAQVVSVDKIHQVSCDVFSPCALGAVLNSRTIVQLQTTIVAGAANNQLEHTHDGQALFERGILYAPDYVINAGGIIFAATKYGRKPDTEIQQRIEELGHTLTKIFERSAQENQPTNLISDLMAREILA